MLDKLALIKANVHARNYDDDEEYMMKLPESPNKTTEGS